MKKQFFDLYYRYVDNKEENHFLKIGYFSNYDQIQCAIQLLKNKPGFIDHNGCFESKKYEVDFSYTTSTIRKKEIILYELSLEYEDENEYDNFEILGLYSTYNEAKRSRSKFIHTVDSKNKSAKLYIAKCTVDLCGWTEGFETF